MKKQKSYYILNTYLVFKLWYLYQKISKVRQIWHHCKAHSQTKILVPEMYESVKNKIQKWSKMKQRLFRETWKLVTGFLVHFRVWVGEDIGVSNQGDYILYFVSPSVRP